MDIYCVVDGSPEKKGRALNDRRRSGEHQFDKWLTTWWYESLRCAASLKISHVDDMALLLDDQ